MRSPTSKVHTMLVVPPVWTPINPYLATSVLAAYLRKEGCSVSQYDASLDFLLEHLLAPSSLSSANRRVELPNHKKHTEGIRPYGVSQAIQGIYDPQAFYEPQRVILNLQSLRSALQLVSRSYQPARIGFNRFVYPEIASAHEMREFCDAGRNPFLPFCKEQFSRRIEEEAPGIVGISLSTPYQLHAAFTMGWFTKNAFPEVHVVLGGSYCRALHDKFVREPSLFGTFFDSLVPGHGERPLHGLMMALSTGHGLEAVLGLTFMDNGSVRGNPAPPPHPLEALPTPDFSDLELDKYLVPRPYLPLRLADGCHWGRCTFCARHYYPHNDILSVEKAVDHLGTLNREHGARDFAINDDCLPPSYVEALCREILNRGIEVSIQLFGKPVSGFTRRRLELLARAGVKAIRWGVESANRRILKLMNKGTDVDVTLRVLEQATRCGIWNHACMIIGFPTERQEEAEETLSWIKAHSGVVHSYFLFEFHLSSESYIFRNPAEFAIKEITLAPGPFSTLAAFSTSEGMSRKQVRDLLREARKELREDIYRNPFWYYLRDREYLQLYLDHFGLERIRGMSVDPRDFSIQPARFLTKSEQRPYDE